MITGAVTSSLSTVIVQVLLLFDASLTVKVTINAPFVFTTVPAAGLCIITSDPAAVQLSLTVNKVL